MKTFNDMNTDKGPALQLVLKRKWFEMIASGEKGEEYRDITDYWVQRLFNIGVFNDNYDLIDVKPITKAYLKEFHKNGGDLYQAISDGIFVPRYCGDVIFYEGYAKGRRSVCREITDTEPGEGLISWGAEPGHVYIIISLGKFVNL